MKALSARNQLIIAIALIVIATAAFVFLAIVPKFQEASALDAQIVTEQTNLANAQALVARRQSAKAQSAANEVELMRIANQVPDSPQLPTMIIELQDVATAAGVEMPQIGIGQISPVPSTTGGSEYAALDFNLSFKGQWSEVIDFCRRLGKMNRGVRLTSANFSYVPAVKATEVEPAKPSAVQGTASIRVYMMSAASSGAAVTGQ
ncbi:MAG: type 4a pilus biogenesis protein PilO [Coriobacteriia bacterium]